MIKLKALFVVIVSAAFFLFLYAFTVDTVEATLKYKRETGKKCTFCHTGIPESGDEDAQLNEDGKKFKENSYQLTEEQTKKP
ncbi:MAG: hypothetical protein ACRD1R_09290 [Acidobacteriota bacterium]